MVRYVGVDVAKATLAVAGAGLRGHWPNTPAGRDGLVAQLCAATPAVQVVLEPTSSYHQPLVLALSAAGIPCTLVNPARSKAYARLLGKRSKTDPVDAQLLAHLGAREEPTPTPPPDEDQEQLKALRRHLEWVEQELRRVKNRAEAAAFSPWTPAAVRESLARTRQQLEAEVQALKKTLHATLAARPEWVRHLALLQTVPGVAEKTAILLLTELPPVAACASPKTWAAFCGVDPALRQSGTQAWSAVSKQGSPQIRARLYLPAASALRFNPAIAALNERLRQKQKPGKVRVLAAMNKLLRQCFAILASGTPYTPSLAQPVRNLTPQYGI